MKYLITGANGFVGQQLCAELARRGQNICACVHSVHQALDTFETVEVGYIDGSTVWAEALRGVDVIVHLAARVHVMKESAADPLAEFLKVNLHGTSNLARQAVQAGVKRLVYVSSIGVNGNHTDGGDAFSESDTLHPHDAYSLSKWQAEQALQELTQEIGLEVVIVRPPLIYGAAAKGNFLRLISAIARGIPLPLAGAKNLRSLLYVGNLVDALIVCATHPAAVGQTYLLSDGEDISTAMLVEKIAAALGKKCRSFYFPPSLLRTAAALLGRSTQVDRLFGSLQVSNQKIRNELGWCPPFTLEQGLRATADWYNRGNS
ncbi:MAG: SDR family oxidoreductase [Gallionella sp.]|nr:SDR family oxidoreductase [Gallionella sp.]